MVRPQRLQKQPAFYRLLVVVCLTAVLLVASPWVSAKEKPRPKPQDWQINGILAALEDSSSQVQGFALSKLGEYDAKDLKSALKKPEAIAQKAGNLLKDKTQAADVRVSAAAALGRISQLDFNQSLIILDSAEYENSEAAQQWRFLVYFLSGGSDEAKTLLKWMGKPQSGSIPTQLNHDEGVKTLTLFAKAWESSKDLPNLRSSLTQQIADVAKMGKWETGDIPLLAKHYQNLSAANSNNADSVKEAMNRLTVWQWFNNAKNTIAIHLSFWLALIFAYPKFPQVQAIFFWNPLGASHSRRGLRWLSAHLGSVPALQAL